MKFKRIFLFICDSLGVGEAIDANKYGDTGANTLGNINSKTNIFIPNLEKLGLLNTINMNEDKNTLAYYSIARPERVGKDILSSYHEMFGVIDEYPYKEYKDGFPAELIDEIEKYCNKKVIGNILTSNDSAIKNFAIEHINTSSLIIYTSKDSVIKVAAHEKVIKPANLYKYCEIIRKIASKKEWRIARVEAIPFNGNSLNTFKVTSNFKEFIDNPKTISVFDALHNTKSVIAIGRVSDLFNGCGITKKIKANTNKEAIDKAIEIMDKKFEGLCVTSLSEYDMTHDFDKDINDYKDKIEALDVEIPVILNKLNNDDLLILTAALGNDPTINESFNTRENVPVIVFNRLFIEPKKLDILNSTSDIGITILDNFNIKTNGGNSFLDKLK